MFFNRLSFPIFKFFELTDQCQQLVFQTIEAEIYNCLLIENFNLDLLRMITIGIKVNKFKLDINFDIVFIHFGFQELSQFLNRCHPLIFCWWKRHIVQSLSLSLIDESITEYELHFDTKQVHFYTVG